MRDRLKDFKDGALIKARDNTLYRMSNVKHTLFGSVGMTVQRVTPKRPAGISPRQWDRMQKAHRRNLKRRAERGGHEG